MSVMFLLNPPEKKKTLKEKLLSLKYSRKMGLPAKKKARLSKTFGRSHITRVLREELGLKKGERPVKHRITFWRHPKADPAKLHSLTRSPLAVLRNARKKRKGVKTQMAKRKQRRNKARSRRRNPIANRRRHVRKNRSNPVANVKRVRKSHRRRGKIRAIVLANPRRRGMRRYRRNSPLGMLANPLKGLKGAMGPVTQAAGLFGGYFVTRTATNYLWKFGLSKVGFLESNKNKKWAEPISQAAVAFGLSYVVNRFMKKPAIAKAVLIGGLFSAVHGLITNIAKTAGLEGKLPAEVNSALQGIVEEPLGYEGVGAYTEEEALSDISEGTPDRYASRY